MTETIKAWYELRRQQRHRKLTHEKFKQDIAEARKNKKSRDHIERLNANEQFEIGLIDDEIEWIATQALRSKSERYLLPWPEFDRESGDWIESHLTGKWHLSRGAMSDVRSQIRQEKKERFQNWQPWILLIIALVGGVTGLISVLKG